MITKNIDLLRRMVTQTTAESTSLETGSVPNSANSPGNAEELELVREEDGAVAMTAARVPHSHTRLQASPATAEPNSYLS